MIATIFVSLFILVVLVGVGSVVVNFRPLKLNSLEQWIISLGVGFLIWSLLLYLSAWLHVRPIITPLIFLLAIYGFAKYHTLLLSRSLLKLPLWAIITIVVGTIGQMVLVFPSGTTTPEGVNFFGINFHDGMWHVTLMETLQKQFPPIVPTFSGVPLQGYHYIVDLFGSELAAVFGLSPLTLTFKLLPILFSLLTGFSMFALMRRLTSSKLAQFTSIFLASFGGSFSFVLPLLHLNMDAGESAFWSQQSITTFINLPLGASFALIMVLILLVLVWLRDNRKWSLLLAALVAGSLVSVKAYAGLLAMMVFCSLLVFQLFQRRQKILFAAFTVAVLLCTALILPQLKLGQQTFIWSPGWFLRTMMEATDRVNYLTWEKQRQIYVYYHNTPRLIQYWGIAFLVFLIGNFGMRSFGILSLFFLKKEPLNKDLPFYFFLAGLVVFGVTIPLFFLQAGVVWNAIQFVYYSLFIMSIFTGLFVSVMPKKMHLLIVILIVIFSMPSTIHTLSDYVRKYQRNDRELVSSDAVAALRFLKSQPGNKTILAGYSENSFVSAFSGLSTYYADRTQADILILETKERSEALRRFAVECRDEPELTAFLDSNDLTYIYIDKTKLPNCSEKYAAFSQLNKIFDNATIRIFQYQ